MSATGANRTLLSVARFRASTHYRSDLSPNERALRLTNVLAKVASMIRDVVEVSHVATASTAHKTGQRYILGDIISRINPSASIFCELFPCTFD